LKKQDKWIKGEEGNIKHTGKDGHPKAGTKTNAK
jgi:hypothetical protein